MRSISRWSPRVVLLLSCISRETRLIFYSGSLKNSSRFRVVSRFFERFWSSEILTGSPDERFPPAIVKISRSAEFVAVKCHAASSPCGRECRKIPLTMRNRPGFLVTRECGADGLLAVTSVCFTRVHIMRYSARTRYSQSRNRLFPRALLKKIFHSAMSLRAVISATITRLCVISR